MCGGREERRERGSYLRDLRNERIVGVRIREEGANGQKHLWDRTHHTRQHAREEGKGERNTREDKDP